MNIHRKTAVIVGVLFIIGTVSGILSAVFTGPILDDPDYLMSVSAHEGQLMLGAFLVLVMGLSLSMVPVMMFPLFKKTNEGLALGAVIFRGALEGTVYLAMVICWLFLVLLSREYTAVGSSQASHFQTLGAILVEANNQINPVLEIVFSLGALMFYTLFYQSRLIPRWLSIWGLVGAVLYFAAGLLAFFGMDAEILVALLGLQEMVLALWLIVKGFNPAAVQ